MVSEIEQYNRQHWDGKAKNYDAKPWQQEMINYIYGALAEQRDLFGLTKDDDERHDFRLLDYACGPGTVTKALLPYVSHIQGIDVSDGMVAEYNARSEAANATHIASAIQGNLLAETPYITHAKTGEKLLHLIEDPEFNNFDAVIVGLGFHHFDNYAGSMRKLAQRVKDGGVIGIIDLVPSEKHWHHVTEDQKKMMHKSGFTEAEMKEYMAEAGLVDFEMVHLPEPIVMVMKEGQEVERRIFFARGRKVKANM